MKTIHLATSLLCAVTLFASCKKERYEVAANPPKAANIQAKHSLPANALVRFKMGTAMTRSIQIKAGTNTLYQSNDIRKLDLFNSIHHQGFAAPAAASYDNFRITLEGFLNSGSPAIWMNGNYRMKDGSIVPVSFMVTSFIRLESKDDLKEVTHTATFLDLLNIDPSYLAADVTADMWEAAYHNTKNLSNGEILVSEQHNPDVFRRMMENLKAMVKVSFTPGTGTPGATDPTVAEEVAIDPSL